MNRRKFIVSSGSILGISTLGMHVSNQKVFAADYELSLGGSQSFSYVDNPHIQLSFNKFTVETQNIDTTKSLKATVSAGLPNKSEPFRERQSKSYSDALDEDSNLHDIKDNLNNDPLVLTDGDLLSEIQSDENGYSFDIELKVKIECDGESIETKREILEINILEYDPSGHILNSDTLVQSSADSGSINENNWLQVMSKDIDTTGEPLLIDFHASVTGANHHSLEMRLLVDGIETTVIRQSDSDSTNEKMMTMFDIVDVTSGTHTITIEWKTHNNQDIHWVDVDRTYMPEWSIQNEASLKLMEINTKSSSYSVKDTTSGSIDSSWETLLSDMYTVDTKNSVILFKSFISAHSTPNYDSNARYKARLRVNGNTVNYTRTSESNDGYNIAALVHAEKYNQGEELNIELQWSNDLNSPYVLDGATSRLGIFEFSDIDNFATARSDSGSAPSNWNTLDNLSIDTSNNLLYTHAHVSADVSNDNDFFIRLLIDGLEKAWQTTGVSDNIAYDNLYISSIDNIPTNTIGIESQWKTEGGTSWVDSKLISIELREEE